ncbi:MBL fold metallo-hydrolase [Halorarum halobium]|uniref:MBL fold metallo-hydrolase n=1 Tax=Halorarum halobium TaxID=3075121 RepID=UPI0028ACD0B1|nr:MBL fold metallo-hydrolase [Halobaculum sp. XH14]
MIENLAAGVQAFTSNAFLVAGEPGADSPPRNDANDANDAGRRVLVDAGSNFDVVARIGEHVEDLDAVVLTHTHPDHVGNLAAVRDAFDVETWGFDASLDQVDNELPDGGTVTMGTAEYEVLHTPGHKDDHLCLYAPEAGVLFAGDLIFQNGGFGRTDLAEGDRDALIRSIDRVRERLDGDLREMHVGHGPSVLDAPGEHVELAVRSARMG